MIVNIEIDVTNVLDTDQHVLRSTASYTDPESGEHKAFTADDERHAVAAARLDILKRYGIDLCCPENEPEDDGA